MEMQIAQVRGAKHLAPHAHEQGSVTIIPDQESGSIEDRLE